MRQSDFTDPGDVMERAPFIVQCTETAAIVSARASNMRASFKHCYPAAPIWLRMNSNGAA